MTIQLNSYPTQLNILKKIESRFKKEYVEIAYDLPSELILTIFSFLNEVDLRQLAPTSRSFSEHSRFSLKSYKQVPEKVRVAILWDEINSITNSIEGTLLAVTALAQYKHYIKPALLLLRDGSYVEELSRELLHMPDGRLIEVVNNLIGIIAVSVKNPIVQQHGFELTLRLSFNGSEDAQKILLEAKQLKKFGIQDVDHYEIIEVFKVLYLESLVN